MSIRVSVLCVLLVAFFCLLVGGIPILGTTMLISLSVDALALLTLLCLSRLLTRGWSFLPYRDVDAERWESFEQQFRAFVDERGV